MKNPSHIFLSYCYMLMIKLMHALNKCTLQATDADKENTTNSDVFYSVLSISEPSVNLTIGERNGEVLLLSSVDYELLKNTTGVTGQVLVVIEARDNGDHALNSNVTLKLDIQVPLK